jgi:uncharacterized membrane protein (DUF441 family)
MDAYIIIAGIIALGIFSKNLSVWLAALVLLVLRALPFGGPALTWMNQYGLKVGITVLTAGLLAPIALGKITLDHLKTMMTSSLGIFALLMGIFVAYLGGRGTGLLTVHPQVVTGLMVGTILGVAFLRGVPVGPLIAAGILALFADVFK